MKKLLLAFCCMSVILMTSCTADNYDDASPVTNKSADGIDPTVKPPHP